MDSENVVVPVIDKKSLSNISEKIRAGVNEGSRLIFGGEILRGFSLAMILGVFFGTYSSIYIANSVLIYLRVSQKTITKEE